MCVRIHAGQRRTELVALAAYAFGGAACAALVVGLLHLRAQRSADSQRTLEAIEHSGCPLHASPPQCDACLQAKCGAVCQDCATNPDCLRLFLCVMDCAEPACERGCATKLPGGRAALVAFLGEQGCLAAHCAQLCP
jgi:hypothetical protein